MSVTKAACNLLTLTFLQCDACAARVHSVVLVTHV